MEEGDVKNFAHLKEDSPFFDLFEGGLVPIVNIIVPNGAHLEGDPETSVYMVDVKKLTPETRLALATRIATKFGARVEEVMDEMHAKGLPIRASQVRAVSSDSLAFL